MAEEGAEESAEEGAEDCAETLPKAGSIRVFSLPGLEVPDAFAPCFRPMLSAGGPRPELTAQKRTTGDAQAGFQRQVLGERVVQREVCTRTSSTRDMTFSEKVSEHGFLREVAQTGAPQEVARGAVMEQTGGTEEGARIQMSNTFLENRKKKRFPKISAQFRLPSGEPELHALFVCMACLRPSRDTREGIQSTYVFLLRRDPHEHLGLGGKSHNKK